MTTITSRRGLQELVGRLRDELREPATAHHAAQRAAEVLRAARPSTQLLSAEERVGDPTRYLSYPLHTETGLSIVALVWRPGQLTPIHDHIAWCSFMVLQGVEHEVLYRHDGDHLTEMGRNTGNVGTVSAFAPPGDIHRVHNVGTTTAVSLHVYGADISVTGSSVRRVYDLPVRAGRHAA